MESLSDDDMKYLTGHSISEFNAIFCFTVKNQLDADWPFQNLPLKAPLLLTLINYRLNFDFSFLGIMFKIHYSSVSKIFKYWTILLSDKFNKVDFWGMRVSGENLYTVILDCTEIPIQKPTSPEEQQATWSSYKNCNTFKSLIVIDEAGTVTFVSTLYGGAASDNVIVAKSGIIQKMKEGDCILADRGFDATDLLAEKGVILNKPPRKNGSQMKENEVAQTRAIAKRRINVERVIGLVKRNRILAQKVPHSLFELMPRIFKLLFWLVNIKKSICKSVDGNCKCCV
ncbi:uncharacterized protein LOC135714283 [Ochlerotatus camptorhynchus]|uniref:uncharacterized protein LOC135714283 n=1 Tax=Ochlerotatus camptorhynchus TaxID=644619 RepID=UPI0031E48A72